MFFPGWLPDHEQQPAEYQKCKMTSVNTPQAAPYSWLTAPIWIGSLIFDNSLEQRAMAVKFEVRGRAISGSCAIGQRVTPLVGTINGGKIELSQPLETHLWTKANGFICGHIFGIRRSSSDTGLAKVVLRSSCGDPNEDRRVCWRYFVRKRNNEKLAVGCALMIVCPLWLLWFLNHDPGGEKGPLSAMIAFFAFLYSLYLVPKALYARLTERAVTYTDFDETILGKTIEVAHSGKWPSKD